MTEKEKANARESGRKKKRFNTEDTEVGTQRSQRRERGRRRVVHLKADAAGRRGVARGKRAA
jgi:hypothetical protein